MLKIQHIPTSVKLIFQHTQRLLRGLPATSHCKEQVPGVSKTGVSDEFTTEGYAVVNPPLGDCLLTTATCSSQFKNPQLTPVLLTPGTFCCSQSFSTQMSVARPGKCYISPFPRPSEPLLNRARFARLPLRPQRGG